MENTSDFSGFLAPVVIAGAVAAVEYAALLIAVVLDLWAGLRKARSRGEATTSAGLRRCVTKASSYFSTLLSLTLMDVPQIVACLYLRVAMEWAAPVFPVFTTVGALAMIMIEGKSIRESAQSKTDISAAVQRLRDALREGVNIDSLIELICKPEADSKNQ